MPDYPTSIYVRDPIIEGWIPSEAALFNDYRSEIVQIETILGAGTGGNSPKGGFASLADRLDGYLSDAGRRRRKVACYWHSDDTTIPTLRGNVRNHIQVGISRATAQGSALLLSGPGPFTLPFFDPYDIGVPPSHVMAQIYIPSGQTVRALQSFILATVTYQNFQVYVQQLTSPAGFINPPTGSPNQFFILWAAFSGGI